jgi:Erythromycin esterase homolog
MEANMPEAYRLNDYVLRGKGDPKKLLAGMIFWTWNTQEVLDFIKWMRKYNVNHSKKVMFAGFDMQYYSGAISELRRICIDCKAEYIVKSLMIWRLT